MIIIPKFQNSSKTPTRQQIEENKRKQEFLNQNGIKVKIDGSWGPWQQGWYNKIKARQTEPKQNWFTRNTIGAAIAENPAIMTASGWQQDKQGDYVQKRTKGSDQLAEDLVTIGNTAITVPTLAGDIRALYNVIRHPIQSTRMAYNMGKDLLWFLKNPRATKVYHVNRQGKTFNLREAKTSSPSNIGIHVASDKSISKTFNDTAPVMEAWIPKHNAEIIDIGANDYRLLSNNYVLDSRQYPNYYDAAGNPKLFYELLKRYGANPVKQGNRIYTSNRVSIPLRQETFPNISESDIKRIDEIIEDGGKFNFRIGKQQSDQKYIRLNQQANDILSNNGYKVIKYTNTNPMEVTKGDGISYIVTDPKVFYNPKSSLNQFGKVINFTKYPIIYAKETE